MLKWTDKQGQEKYTTKIVLRPYSGEPIMLDGRKHELSHALPLLLSLKTKKPRRKQLTEAKARTDAFTIYSVKLSLIGSLL